ncbi:MAG: DUF1684 domain-containing protein, partial [Ignavibacteriaceae bacterium]|nr:DUF1684 domain-containing protein [Ignavibacteriaceae bacterium]
ERAEKDFNLKNDPHSPFNRDPNAKYDKLKYFDPDTNYIFKSILYSYEKQDTITIMGTKGEQRKAIKEGYVVLNFESEEHKLNVYKSFSQQSQPYYSIWFTDLTTGKETYKVGRYLDFEFLPNEDFVYTIDFNKAYSPYCAYSDLFTCPIPTEEDYLNFEVKAGEKSFH